MEKLQLVGVRNANWQHHGEHRKIAIRCFNVNLDNDPDNSKSNLRDENPDRAFSLTVRSARELIMAKRHDNLFDEICSEDNLLLAFRKARRGKGNKHYVKEFEKDLSPNLIALKKELETGEYEPMPLYRFVIRDPKIRVIHAPVFRDRVVHHAICNVLNPIFDKTFIHDSYASRKGKGTHAALQRFDLFKKKVSRNGTPVPHAKDDNMVCGWVLKADIRHYFSSVNHNILMNLIERKLSDKKITDLLQKIILTYSTTENKGMPLGALTSQLFANIYLNPIDHFIKEKLHVKFYLRYLDDFIILHGLKEQLIVWKDKIDNFLSSNLNLKLHPEKTSIFPMHRGVPFVGFRYFYYYRLPKKNSTRCFLEKYDAISDSMKARKSMEGWFAHVSWADTYKMRQKMMPNFYKLMRNKS